MTKNLLLGAIGLGAFMVGIGVGNRIVQESMEDVLFSDTLAQTQIPPGSLGKPGDKEKNALSEDSQNMVENSQGEKVSAQRARLDCSNFRCYEEYYVHLLRTKDVAAAFTDLKERYQTDSYVKSMCHPLVHVFGRTAVEKYPKVSEAFSHGDPFCWSGYFHGVMEGILRKTNDKDLPQVIKAVCDDIPGKEKYTFDYYNCVHGLGHGVMYVTNNELFDALQMCNNLEGSWEQQSCWGGVFMENVIADFENHFTKYLKPEDPLYPCNAVDEMYRPTCYLMQTSYMLKVTNYDFQKVFELCTQAGSDTLAGLCYQSLGRDASGSTISDPLKTKNYCLLGKDFRQQSSCVIGAVKDFISYFHSDIQAKEFCGALRQDLGQICFDTAETYYRTF
ncbi:MAG: hypothetical protein AAB567_02595 [Patescibacteria group bacterium]